MIKLKKIDKKILLPITAGLLYIPFTILSECTEIAYHSIIFSLSSSIGMTLSIIPLLISRYNMRKAMANKHSNSKSSKSSKKTNDKNQRKKLNVTLIYNKSIIPLKKNKFLFIFLSSLSDFVQTIIASTTYNYEINLNLWLLDIIFLSILSYIILKTKLFRHQTISMILIIIFGVILDYCFGNFSNIFDNILFLLLRILCEFNYSLCQVINKYCMEFKFSPPYEVCLFIGIYTSIFYLICLIISTFLPCNFDFCYIIDEKNNEKYFDNFWVYVSKINRKELLLVLALIFTLFLMNIFIILTIKYYTPFHFVIILIIGKIAMITENFFFGIELYDIIKIISLIIILIGLLVYVEVIILNFCGIQKNTKENIEKRCELDIIYPEQYLNKEGYSSNDDGDINSENNNKRSSINSSSSNSSD